MWPDVCPLDHFNPGEVRTTSSVCTGLDLRLSVSGRDLPLELCRKGVRDMQITCDAFAAESHGVVRGVGMLT